MSLATQRLDLNDPTLLAFEAEVIGHSTLGDGPAVVLDRTAFFPEGGGQPADHGTLGNRRVTDVQQAGELVLHRVDELLPLGSKVKGQVDAARRRDHLQQHHGQHLLSAAFLRLENVPTVSFHMGATRSTIDVKAMLGKLDDALLRRIEAEANRSVWSSLPVEVREFSEEEIAALPLRKEPVKGRRIVVVDGGRIDASPCGGTHPARTSEVGAIAILGVERWGNDLCRVTFVCGDRVLRELDIAQRRLASMAAALGSNTERIEQDVPRMRDELQGARKAVDVLTAEWAALVADSRHSAQPDGALQLRLEGKGAMAAKAVALALVERGRTAFVVGVEGERAHLVFGRPKGAPGPAMNDLLKAALVPLEGKGGGRPEFAQGSGRSAGLEAVLASLPR